MMLAVFTSDRLPDNVIYLLGGLVVASGVSFLVGLIWSFSHGIQNEDRAWVIWVIIHWGIPLMIYAYDLRHQRPVIFRFVWVSFFAGVIVIALGSMTLISAFNKN